MTMFKYDAVSELVSEAERSGKKISELVLDDQAAVCETSKEKLYKKMFKSFRIMQSSVEDGMAGRIPVLSADLRGEAHGR